MVKGSVLGLRLSSALRAPKTLMQLTVHRTIQEVRPYAEAWARLVAQETGYAPAFEDLLAELSPVGSDFRFMAVRDGEEIRALACFLLWRGNRTFWLSEQKLFSIGVPMTALFAESTGASAMLGNPDSAMAAMMLRAILADPKTGWLELGDIPAGSGLHQATRTLGWRALVQDDDRGATRRLIPLADGFAAYFASLRTSTRKAVQRDCRLFERLSPEFRTVTAPEDVAHFLREATDIRNRTYQTRIGTPFHDDDETRARLIMLAQAGRLRGYMAYVDGMPSAFAWGDVSNDVFYFRMTSYDPELRKSCAGTAILFHVLRDLADGRHCAHFDFGVRDMEYKERFGTIAIPYTVVSIARWTNPPALLAFTADFILTRIKALLDRILSPRQLSRIRRLLWR